MDGVYVLLITCLSSGGVFTARAQSWIKMLVYLIFKRS